MRRIDPQSKGKDIVYNGSGIKIEGGLPMGEMQGAQNVNEIGPEQTQMDNPYDSLHGKVGLHGREADGGNCQR
ncbi:hypothetical protein ACH5RR_036897 [Cinchona calisaya]|uniref:Uncharacterized protein n=1 Tax=Cinchona calisaya TaxID=153742 RepID=A0ABD2Y5U4_9GENT